MEITRHKVVSLGYQLQNEAGERIESRDATTPLIYLHGEGLLLPTLEQNLEGKQSGDPFSLTLTPEQAYGERDPELVQQVPREALGGQPAQPSTELHGNLEQTATVTEVNGDSVTIDANPPLAGMTLMVEGQVIDVRDATPEEVSSGHAEGQDDGSQLILVTMRSQKEVE